MAILHVDPETLDLSLGRLRQLPESVLKSMEASLRAKGQLSPLVAARLPDGTLVLVDGFARRLAAVRAGMPTVAVEVLELSPVQMKAQLFLRNRERGLMLLEECRLVRELVELDGLTQVEVGDLLERHKSWVCRRHTLIVTLSPHVVAEAELGRLLPGTLRKLALLPARNQEDLWTAAARTELQPRDVERLVDLWRRAPEAEARRFLIEQPVEALRIARGAPEPLVDVRLGKAGEEVRSVLETLRRASLRLARRIRDGVGPLPPEGMAVLTEASRTTSAEVDQALRTLRAWLEGGTP
jgi:ParB-like chromosome segregation protein Spo0J